MSGIEFGCSLWMDREQHRRLQDFVLLDHIVVAEVTDDQTSSCWSPANGLIHWALSWDVDWGPGCNVWRCGFSHTLEQNLRKKFGENLLSRYLTSLH